MKNSTPKTTNKDILELIRKESRILNALISLTENIQNMRIKSVDLSDFFTCTGNSKNSYIFLDKYSWSNKTDLTKQLEINNIITDTKSIWVDIRFTKNNSNNCIELIDLVYLTLEKQFDKSVEIIIVDLGNQKEDSISIIGFN